MHKTYWVHFVFAYKIVSVNILCAAPPANILQHEEFAGAFVATGKEQFGEIFALPRQ